eukprot:scaffold21879_cov15-Tisochrysis_lutea.AAC.2
MNLEGGTERWSCKFYAFYWLDQPSTSPWSSQFCFQNLQHTKGLPACPHAGFQLGSFLKIVIREDLVAFIPARGLVYPFAVFDSVDVCSSNEGKETKDVGFFLRTRYAYVRPDASVHAGILQSRLRKKQACWKLWKFEINITRYSSTEAARGCKGAGMRGRRAKHRGTGQRE